MKRNILFLILIISFAFVSCKKDEPAPIASVEITDLAIEASYTKADIQWNVTSSASVSEAVVEYSTDSTFDKFEQKQMIKVSPKANDGQYKVSITPLTERTEYYVRCRAINKYSSYPSNALSFATRAYHLPKVSSDSITAITVSEATLHAQLLDWGTDTLPQVGFCIAKHADASIADSCIVCSLVEKKDSIIYALTLNKLNDKTKYYVRAFARNHKGVAYGKELSFTTIEIVPPTVGNTTISNISYTTATAASEILGDGGASITERGICYSTSQNPTTSNSKITKGSGTGSFTCNMTGLTAGKKYYVRAYAINSKGTAYGKEVTFTTTAYGLPTVTTSAATNVSYTTATCGGNVTADGGQTVTERGICYSTSQNPTTSNTKITKGNGTGAFTCNITGLTAGTKYYVRAYAKNSKGTAYGNQVTFTTTAYGLPTVTTSAVTNISYTTATCGGNVTADGGQSVTARGVCYSTSSNPTISGSKVASGSGTGSFSCNLTGLTAGKTYYVRAYATNSKGTAYGNQFTFTTTAYQVPTVTTQTPSNISYTTATCGGNVTTDGGQNVTARGICYSTSPNPTTANSKVTSGSGIGSFTCNLSGLLENTTYHIRAYAINSNGTAYGNQISFTTLDRYNGHSYIDLGLSVKWATMNVGASSIEDYGAYYSWGEVNEKTSYYKSYYTYQLSPSTLPADADAATVNWGGIWRMPTYEEFKELIDNCTITLDSENGYVGYRFSRNGKNIFFPAAGSKRGTGEASDTGRTCLYWTSSLYLSYNEAWYMVYQNISGGTKGMSYGDRAGITPYGGRYSGMTIRAVCP